MSETVFLFIAASIALALIPIVPKMLCLRIKVLRFLRLRWLADLHKRYFEGIVTAVRVTMGGIGIVLLVLWFERI